jgi:hypothetical protein
MEEYEDLEAVMEEPFRRIEEQTSMRTEDRMERMERLLDDLERELDEFLKQADRTSVS